MALTIKQERFVAALVGAAKGNATEAARLAGYAGDTRTLQAVGAENLSKPLIVAAIAEYRSCLKLGSLDTAQQRVDVLLDLAQRFLTVIAERAADPGMQDIPGGKTGLVVRQWKGAGSQIREEFAPDTALSAEIRATVKQIAQEKGQWSEKSEITGKNGGPIVLSQGPDLSGLSLDDLLALEAIAGRVAEPVVDSP